MAQYYFVSPATGHSWVKDFRDNDFKFWYVKESGMIKPLLQTMVQANGWNSLLLTGNTTWTGSNQYSSAVAVKTWGRGRVVISQLLFTGCLRDNPTSYKFLMRPLAE